MKLKSRLAFLVLIVCIGCDVKQPAVPKSSANVVTVEETSPVENLTESLRLQAPPTEPLATENAKVVQLTAREFYDEKKKDPQGTFAKYEGSWVEISGDYFGVRTAPGDDAQENMLVATMFPSGPGLKKDVISCHLHSGERPWEKVTAGDEITIRGSVRLFAGNVYLADCQIIKSGQPSLNVDVAKLVELVKSDLQTFTNQYRDKQLIVSGKFAGNISPPESTDKNVIALDGVNGERIFASFVGLGRDFKNVNIGDPITIIGGFNSYPATDDALRKEAILVDVQCLNAFVNDK